MLGTSHETYGLLHHSPQCVEAPNDVFLFLCRTRGAANTTRVAFARKDAAWLRDSLTVALNESLDEEHVTIDEVHRVFPRDETLQGMYDHRLARAVAVIEAAEYLLGELKEKGYDDIESLGYIERELRDYRRP